MSELKRYNPVVHWAESGQFSWHENKQCSKPTVKIVESSNGQFVKYSDVSARIEQLEREKIGLVAERERLANNGNGAVDRAIRSEQERDALAAHVEQANRYIKQNCIPFVRENDDHIADILEKFIEKSPQTSLTEVKAKQAYDSVIWAFEQALPNYCDLPRVKRDKSRQLEIAEYHAQQHAAKIREGGHNG